MTKVKNSVTLCIAVVVGVTSKTSFGDFFQYIVRRSVDP